MRRREVSTLESNRDFCYTSRPLWGEVRVKIDISQLEHEPVRFDENILISVERLDPDQVAGPMKVRLEGEVRPQGDVFSVSGRCAAEGRLTCSRCLEPVEWTVEENFSLEYRVPALAPADAESGLDEGELDVAFLQGEELDLSELAAEQVLLSLPMRIVCRPDCAGLCSRCGANLNNEEGCDCEPEIDPRWSALADLAGNASES